MSKLPSLCPVNKNKSFCVFGIKLTKQEFILFLSLFVLAKITQFIFNKAISLFVPRINSPVYGYILIYLILELNT